MYQHCESKSYNDNTNIEVSDNLVQTVQSSQS